MNKEETENKDIGRCNLENSVIKNKSNILLCEDA